MTTGKYAGDIPGGLQLRRDGHQENSLTQLPLKHQQVHLSYRLNSLKGGYIGGSIGDYYRVDSGGY